MEKNCFKCRQIKDLNEFYKHKGMKDGYLGKCKECTKKDVLAHRKKNIKRIRKYDRQRAILPHRKALKKRIQKKYREEKPMAVSAQRKAERAVKNGGLKKPNSCELCEVEGRIHGHHSDYSEPLKVIWVCVPCHSQIHHSKSK